MSDKISASMNAREIMGRIRQEAMRELETGDYAMVVGQHWITFDDGPMVYIHTVFTSSLVLYTIGVPLPEMPPAVTITFEDAIDQLKERFSGK